ncbi:MAG: CpaF family protein [Candidatus Omnitrophica bacterium]|nr:CpaF family protein [Candidatus Omnitrophota bacterium]
MKKDIQGLKEGVKNRLLEYVSNIRALDEAIVRTEAQRLIRSMGRRFSLSEEDQEGLVSEIISDILGLGPIQPFLENPLVSEILVNGPDEVYIEQAGRLIPTEIKFKDKEQLQFFIDRVLSRAGRRATELEPYIDARLEDGSRVNIVRPPACIGGPILTIRKFSRSILGVDDLIGLKTIDAPIASFLEAAVKARLNVVICGGTSAGKTTLLNILASFIPEDERIITAEDTAELNITNHQTVRLQTRPVNIEGKGEITIRQLVKNALHMRPDRIIVGEVRGDEVFDMIQAMNTGQEGSLCTIHANSAEDALERMAMLLLMGMPNISYEAGCRQIIFAVDLIVRISKLRDGSRKLVEVCEVVKNKEAKFLVEDVFRLDQEKLEFTGKIPHFYPKLQEFKFNFSSGEDSR